MKKICFILIFALAANLFAADAEDAVSLLLSGVHPGEIRCGVTVFPVQKGNFPAALLAGNQRQDRNLQKEIILPPESRGSALHLLHAFDACNRKELGKVKVIFGDGSSQTLTISAKEDCADFRGLQ